MTTTAITIVTVILSVFTSHLNGARTFTNMSHVLPSTEIRCTALVYNFVWCFSCLHKIIFAYNYICTIILILIDFNVSHVYRGQFSYIHTPHLSNICHDFVTDYKLTRKYMYNNETLTL